LTGPNFETWIDGDISVLTLLVLPRWCGGVLIWAISGLYDKHGSAILQRQW
jgi:hypothetical protein